MTRTELNKLLLDANKEFDYSAHEQLVHLTCVYENDDEEFEVTFAVPFYWTLEQTGFNTWGRLQHWLQNILLAKFLLKSLSIAIKEPFYSKFC